MIIVQGRRYVAAVRITGLVTNPVDKEKMLVAGPIAMATINFNDTVKVECCSPHDVTVKIEGNESSYVFIPVSTFAHCFSRVEDD